MTQVFRELEVVRLEQVRLHYGKVQALAGITLGVSSGCMVGLIGPDGVGKSSLLSLVAGARAVQEGRVQVLGGDMSSKRHRNVVCPRIAYMPQGLGKNLYPTLSVEENLQFFARLFGHDAAERRRRIDDLTNATGLRKFLSRPAGKLSGGMKQKLGLACAMLKAPQLLLLDEEPLGLGELVVGLAGCVVVGRHRSHPLAMPRDMRFVVSCRWTTSQRRCLCPAFQGRRAQGRPSGSVTRFIASACFGLSQRISLLSDIASTIEDETPILVM